MLDNEKHYWVGEDEIQKLLNRGEGWLAQHPEKDFIVSRYLKRQRHLTREALERLSEDEPEEREPRKLCATKRSRRWSGRWVCTNSEWERCFQCCAESARSGLWIWDAAKANCCDHLLADPQFESILGMDVSWRSLEIAEERLKLDQLPERQRARISLIQGSLMYRDERIERFRCRCGRGGD